MKNNIFMAAIMLILCSCGKNATGQDSKSADDNGQTEVRQEETDAAEESQMNAAERNDAGNPAAVPPPEEFVLIQGGTFQMGSPEEEAWRSEDEVRHTVTVSDFYMGTYELTQAEYQEIAGENPSSFSGRIFRWRIFPGWMPFPTAMPEVRGKD